MKITINDVAKRANVSKATVSRVLNKKGNVSEEVIDRVKNAMKELNYYPSGIARSMSSQKTGLIGLIIPDITNPFFPMLARGVEDSAHRLGYTVLQCNTDNNLDIEEGYIEKLMNQGVEGFVVVPSNTNLKSSKKLLNYHTPFVFCDRFSPEIDVDSVAVDNYKAAYEATTYLIQQGHRRILHINVSSLIEPVKNREKGYIDAMKNAGLIPLIRYGTLTFESGYQIALSMIQSLKPTAIFTANDMLALGVIKGLQEAGVKIPEDIAIIGCDDIFASKIVSPSLTTILQPAYQMGVKSFEMLHERLSGYNDKARKLMLDHRLVLRESTEGKFANDERYRSSR